MKAQVAPPGAFHCHQPQDHHQHHQRKLCRPAGIAARQPDGKDAGGQGLHPEIADGAVIVHRLHRGQGHTGRDGGSRQRQAHAQEQPPGPAAQGAGHLVRAARLLAEGGTRQKIDIRVKGRRQNQNGGRHRPHFGKPVVTGGLPAHRAAQRALHRPRIFQKIHQRIGPDIGRNRQGQQQCVIQHARQRKAVHRQQPGSPCAHGGGQKADAHHQGQGRGQIARQDGGQHMRPDVFRRGRGNPQHRPDRHQHDGRDQKRPCRPGVKPGQPGLAPH